MVKSTILDSVVELGHARRVELLLLDVAKVFEQLLPAFPEQPRFVLAAPRHYQYLRCAKVVYAKNKTYHRSWSLSMPIFSQLRCMISRNEDNSSMTSCAPPNTPE